MKELFWRIYNTMYERNCKPRHFLIVWNETIDTGGLRCRCAAFETVKEANKFCRRLTKEPHFFGFASIHTC